MLLGGIAVGGEQPGVTAPPGDVGVGLYGEADNGDGEYRFEPVRVQRWVSLGDISNDAHTLSRSPCAAVEKCRSQRLDACPCTTTSAHVFRGDRGVDEGIGEKNEENKLEYKERDGTGGARTSEMACGESDADEGGSLGALWPRSRSSWGRGTW